MNCRDPAATPIVMLPSVTAEVFAMLRTSPTLHSGGATIQVVHAVDDFRFQWFPLCSDPGIGSVEVLERRQHQDWVTHNVAIVRVTLICQDSVFLQHVPRVMSTSELFRPTKLENCRFLQPGRVSAWSRCSSAANPRKGARRLPGGNASSHLRCHHTQSQAALQEAVNVSAARCSCRIAWP